MPENTDITRIVRLEERVKYLEERTQKSDHEISELKGTVQLYQVSATTIKNRLDTIVGALKGDEMGTPGIVKRMGVMEENTEKLDIIVTNMDSWIKNAKSYMFGIIAGAGAVAGAIYWVIQTFMDYLK